MRSRRWLISTSIGVHVAVVFVLFVSGVWNLERLEAHPQHVDISMAPSPPPAAAGGPGLPEPKFDPKKPKPHPEHTVQLETKPPEAPASDTPATTGPGTEPGDGPGPGTGPGTGTNTKGVGDDPCVNDCDELKKKKVDEQIAIPPTVLRGLRISGETQIEPPDMVKTEIMRAGGGVLQGVFKLCIDTNGNVASIGMVHGTGYSGYDNELTRRMREWHYKPYFVNKRPIPACGIVTFKYSMK